LTVATATTPNINATRANRDIRLLQPLLGISHMHPRLETPTALWCLHVHVVVVPAVLFEKRAPRHALLRQPERDTRCSEPLDAVGAGDIHVVELPEIGSGQPPNDAHILHRQSGGEFLSGHHRPRLEPPAFRGLHVLVVVPTDFFAELGAADWSC